MVHQVRDPLVAGRFYPGSENDCRRAVQAAQQEAQPGGIRPQPAVAGIAPHAGWDFCSRAIARVTDALLQTGPECLILFGAVHRGGVDRAVIDSSDCWQTPLGYAPVHDALRQELRSRHPGLFILDDYPHAVEHSIEVQLPFIQESAPELPILPTLVPPEAPVVQVGEAVRSAARDIGLRTAALGSTDLTHYGHRFYDWAPKGQGEQALKWVREDNDRRIVNTMLQMRAEEAVIEARTHRNACGAGAIAATIAYARAAGASRGILLDYTTSHDEMPRGEPANFVGYAGVAFPAA